MYEDLFFALFGCEAKLVEPLAPLLLLVFSTVAQSSGRATRKGHLFAVVNPAGNDRLVGIALEEIDNDFLSDPRQ